MRHHNKYVLVVVAPDGKGVFVAFMKKKSNLVAALRHNRRAWQRKAGVTMEILRMDRAGEQTGEEMKRFLEKHGIEASLTAPGSSAGPAEAYIHLLQDTMVAMLNHYQEQHGGRYPAHLWELAFQYAAELKNMTPCTRRLKPIIIGCVRMLTQVQTELS